MCRILNESRAAEDLQNEAQLKRNVGAKSSVSHHSEGVDEAVIMDEAEDAGGNGEGEGEGEDGDGDSEVAMALDATTKAVKSSSATMAEAGPEGVVPGTDDYICSGTVYTELDFDLQNDRASSYPWPSQGNM